MKRKLAMAAILTLLLTGCAAGPNNTASTGAVNVPDDGASTEARGKMVRGQIQDILGNEVTPESNQRKRILDKPE